MSDVFLVYEKEFCKLLENLSKKCSSAFALKGERKNQKLYEIKSDVENAGILIEKMDFVARKLPPNIKSNLLAKLREYKANMKRIIRELRTITYGNLNASTPDELLKADIADIMATSADQRSRLMKSTKDLVRTTRIVEDSQRKMQETEEIGFTLVQSMIRQRKSLQNSHETLYEIDANIIECESIVIDMLMAEESSWTAWIWKKIEYVAISGAFVIILLIKILK